MRRRLRSERGEGLIELLVATAVGIVVLMAGFAIVETGSREANRTNDRAEVAKSGRGALEALTKVLHSQTCLGPGVPAIVTATDTSITFYADLGDTNFTPQKRTITFSGGTLSEDMYTGTGTPPAVTFSSTAAFHRVLATNLTTAGATPFFTYYAFTTTDPITPSLQLPTPLSTTDAARTVQISVSFQAHPKNTAWNDQVSSTFQSQVFARTADTNDPVHSPQCL